MNRETKWTIKMLCGFKRRFLKTKFIISGLYKQFKCKNLIYVDIKICLCVQIKLEYQFFASYASMIPQNADYVCSLLQYNEVLLW